MPYSGEDNFGWSLGCNLIGDLRETALSERCHEETQRSPDLQLLIY